MIVQLESSETSSATQWVVDDRCEVGPQWGLLINNYTWPLHVTWHSQHRGLVLRTRVPRGSQKEASEVMLYYSLHILLLRSKSLKPLIFKGRRIMLHHLIKGSSLVVQIVKNLSAIQETWVESLGWEDPLEKEMAPAPVFFPEKSYGQRSLVGYSPRNHKESGMTECVHTYTHTHTHTHTETLLYSFCQSERNVSHSVASNSL